MSSEIGQENSRSGPIVAAAITVVTLSFFAVLLRLISRLALIRRTTLDDLFIVVAWVATFHSLLLLHRPDHLSADCLGYVHCTVSWNSLWVGEA